MTLLDLPQHTLSRHDGEAHRDLALEIGSDEHLVAAFEYLIAVVPEERDWDDEYRGP